MKGIPRDRLILEHLDWAHRIAGRVARRIPAWRRDELISAANLALVESAAAYDPGCGYAYTVAAWKYVYFACWEVVRLKNIKRRDHLNVDDLVLTDPRPGPENYAIRRAIVGKVRALAPRERSAIENLYGREITHRDLAREMGCTRARISQLHHDALMSLRVSIGLPIG